MTTIRFDQGVIAEPRPFGTGTTAMNIVTPLLNPGCRVALLVVSPSLLQDVIENYKALRGTRLPSISVHSEKGRWTWLHPGVPSLHVISSSKLSRADSCDFLELLAPDLIIVDASVRMHKESARTARLAKYLAGRHHARFVIWAEPVTQEAMS